ncbi:MAG: hypothetical protein ACC645_10460, partial [Pirellulales bacterium]
RAFVIATTPADRHDFRACLGPLAAPDADSVQLEQKTAQQLGVASGDFVRYVPLRTAREP